uniref:Uncharacterized protein isoform X2 n=1 Tax=Nicotiana tabacum TaxID=4097 RepID=A0A1S4AKM4_TOBAC|nr:PREDICTED: uncharacterized protein LOC107798653 isoform X2 [Nicotiana tabacum]
MAERFNINAITPETEEWTCKIQVVDKGRSRDNREKTKKYQLMVLQDEEIIFKGFISLPIVIKLILSKLCLILLQENQVECVIFNAEIMHFADLFRPFHTYSVSVAQVKESNYMYGNPINKFTWTIDSCTIFEPIETVNPPEEPLPLPTRLNLTPFDNFEYQPEGSEFDVLAIVLNASPSTYASNGRRIQDFIIMDDQSRSLGSR